MWDERSYNFNFEERGKFAWEGLKRFARKIKVAYSKLQGRIQRFKEVSQTDQFKSFPLQLSRHEDIPQLAFVLRHKL